MHKNDGLLDILEIVQDFDFQRLFVEGRKHVDLMFTYIGVSFRLMGFSRDTIIACLIEELEMLRSFLAENGTLSSSHTDVIVAHMQHCLVQDTVAQHILKDRVDGCNIPATDTETTLNIDANVGRDTLMEIEETPGSSFLPFRPIK